MYMYNVKKSEINGFKWNPAIWNEYRGFLEKAYERFI